MSLKLFLSKSKGKVLFAEVDENFVELLFSFLTFPLGSIVKCLGGCTAMKCLDNLYGSVDASGFKNCMKSEECKALLLCPKLAQFYSCKNQLIQIEEQQLHHFVLSSGLKFFNHYKDVSGISFHPGKKLSVVNPKCPYYEGTTYMNEMMFMVTDELVVEPLSPISCVSFLSRLKISTDDLEERVISVGKKEALSLLKACLTSKTVLTDVFLKKRK